MFYLHGEVAECAPVSEMFKTVLLRVYPPLAHRTAVAVSALSSTAADQRVGQLQMGRRGHAAPRCHTTVRIKRQGPQQ